MLLEVVAASVDAMTLLLLAAVVTGIFLDDMLSSLQVVEGGVVYGVGIYKRKRRCGC